MLQPKCGLDIDVRRQQPCQTDAVIGRHAAVAPAQVEELAPPCNRAAARKSRNDATMQQGVKQFNKIPKKRGLDCALILSTHFRVSVLWS